MKLPLDYKRKIYSDELWNLSAFSRSVVSNSTFLLHVCSCFCRFCKIFVLHCSFVSWLLLSRMVQEVLLLIFVIHVEPTLTIGQYYRVEVTLAAENQCSKHIQCINCLCGLVQQKDLKLYNRHFLYIHVNT